MILLFVAWELILVHTLEVGTSRNVFYVTVTFTDEKVKSVFYFHTYPLLSLRT